MSPFTWSPREKKLAIAFVVILIFAIGALLWNQEDFSLPNNNQFPNYQQPTFKPVEAKKAPTIAVIDIKGAVKKPGIYRLPAPVRLYQLLQAAGGTLDEADLKRINQAKVINDGSMVYIPKQGEQIPTEATPILTQSETTKDKLNINTATLDELVNLEGLGPSKANAVIQYRGEHGGFKSVEELLNVPGIGQRTLSRIKDKVYVE